MADNDAVSSAEPPPPPVAQQWPTLTLPPRAGIESLFSGSGFGLSPGPMTPFSNFFSEGDPNSDCRSFSPLLEGAMDSPWPSFPPAIATDNYGADHLHFNQNPPTGPVISQPPQQGVFTVPPGVSPASLLESCGLFPGQGPFGMFHQQSLAQVTAQAQPNLHMQGNFPSSVGVGLQASAPFPGFTSESMQQNMMPSAPVSEEPFQISSTDQRSQRSSIIVDKPADDGYKWRKYGQRQVTGSELIQSYYKCMHPNCLVRKKVGCSLNGQVTEIIYKGQHGHQPPQELSKNSGNHNENLGNQEIGNMNSTSEGMAYSLSRMDQESSQDTTEHMTSDEEEVGNDGTRESEGDEDEPDAKRRNMEVGVSEQAASHRAVTEPKFIIQTTSEVDLLDDGYRWRKYGQKVVKGNPHPRSYYKCTTTGCNVRKHIERPASDPKEVRTTYEGRHNHEVPEVRTSSHNSTANNRASQLRPHNSGANNDDYIARSDFTSNNQQIVAVLRIKEERIT